MNDYLTVLGLSMLPALGNFVGGLLVEVFRYSTRTLSLALYAAAGIVLAVIGMELMPQALEAEFPLLMILLFAGGAVFSILIDRGIEHFHRQLKGEESDTPPVMIFLGAAVDLFTDGLIIGTGSTIARELGLLLALENSACCWHWRKRLPMFPKGLRLSPRLSSRGCHAQNVFSSRHP